MEACEKGHQSVDKGMEGLVGICELPSEEYESCCVATQILGAGDTLRIS